MAHGWLLADNDTHGLRIERWDEAEMFASDEDALAHVERVAACGGRPERRALATINAHRVTLGAPSRSVVAWKEVA